MLFSTSLEIRAFMLVLEKQENDGGQMFYAIVQLIGTRRQVSSIQISSDETTSR